MHWSGEYKEDFFKDFRKIKENYEELSGFIFQQNDTRIILKNLRGIIRNANACILYVNTIKKKQLEDVKQYAKEKDNGITKNI